MTNEQEKSDLFIVAMKLANKPGRPGAESVEPRKRTEGNTGEQHTCRTQSRESVSQRLDWVRGAARGASSFITRGRSPVRELRPPGSVRGVPSNGHPYRDSGIADPQLLRRYQLKRRRVRYWESPRAPCRKARLIRTRIAPACKSLKPSLTEFFGGLTTPVLMEFIS